MNIPSYLKLFKNKELDNRIEQAYEILRSCTLCPNNCNIDRNKKSGICKSGILPEVSSFNPHHGEEPPISGVYGSGTIFFTNCTLSCKFCQNYPISQLGNGKEVSINSLADILLFLQRKRCHNVNLVTPTHFVPMFLKALKIAIEKGFKLPIVYNSSGYDSVEILKILNGIIDIYLPDMKYGDSTNALKYSGVKDYFEYNKLAIKEMFSQVGLLRTDRNGIAIKGLMIRHLVLPYNISDSKKILQFLKDEISNKITISIMAQYFPVYKAVNDDKLKFKITPEEYKEVVNFALSLGFENSLVQEI